MALLRQRGGGLLATGPDAVRANAMREQQRLLGAARAPTVIRAPTQIIQEENPLNSFGEGLQQFGQSLTDRRQQQFQNQLAQRKVETDAALAKSLVEFRQGQIGLGTKKLSLQQLTEQRNFILAQEKEAGLTARQRADLAARRSNLERQIEARKLESDADRGVTMRGQDLTSSTARRGQDLNNARAEADRKLRERAFGLQERKYNDQAELQKNVTKLRKQAADAYEAGEIKKAQALALRADTTASTLQALMQGKTTAAGISPKNAPKLPRGMEYVLNAQGNVVLEADDKGGFTFKKRKIAPDNKALNDAKNKAIEQYNLADRAIDFIMQKPNAATGALGAYTSILPGTPGFTLDQTLETLRAALSFEALDIMRRNSPTGGALGQVSNYEVGLLQKERTNLAIGQTPEILIANLRRLQRLRMLIISPMDKDSVLVDLFDKNDVVNNPKAPGEKLTFQQWFYDNRMIRPESVTDEELLQDWNKLKGGGSG